MASGQLNGHDQADHAERQVADLRAVRRRGQLAHARHDIGEPGRELEARLDHVHLDLALGTDLAVLARQQLDALVVVGGQRAEARLHARGALVRAERRPGREGVVRRGDGGARLLLGGRTRVADHALRVGGVVDGEAVGGLLALAGDEQAGVDLGQRLGHGRIIPTAATPRCSSRRRRRCC